MRLYACQCSCGCHFEVEHKDFLRISGNKKFRWLIACASCDKILKLKTRKIWKP